MKRLAAIAVTALALGGIAAAPAPAAPPPASVQAGPNNGCIIILNWTVLCIPRL